MYLGTAASDIYFHDSYFVVGHFHFMIGVVTSFGIFAAIHYWFPKMFGRHMSETLGKIHFWFTIVAVFIAPSSQIGAGEGAGDDRDLQRRVAGHPGAARHRVV